MCHPEIPAGQETPVVTREEVAIALSTGERMPALLARPERPNGGTVLIAHDIFGRSPFYENLAARLATAGFAALLPDYFFRQGRLAEPTIAAAYARRGLVDENDIVRDLADAVDWLRAQPGALGKRLGTVGFCMGGTFVIDLTTLRDDLTTVSYYPFPAPTAIARVAAPAPLQIYERIRGPILAFWGDQDHGVDMADARRLGDLLVDRGVSFEYTIYPGLGHGFLATSQFDPNHEAYQVACDSWTRSLAFLREKLTAPVTAPV